MHSRRRFLAALPSAATLSLAAALAGCASPRVDVEPPTDADRPTAVGSELVADGFVAPVAVEQPVGDDRLFVADQPGTITAVAPDGSKTTYLDLQEQVVNVSGYDERGLLGLAFHPDFADNGRFYVRYSAPPRPGTPAGYSHTAVLAEFTADPDAAFISGASERTVLTVPEPQSNHNGGALAFGPDDLLYVSLGDGGGANDAGTGHVEDWYGQNPGGNGQDISENLLGSILRLNVDARTNDHQYGIPADNPLVGEDGLDEHYAWGFRNPWRMSFDGDDLYVADVGQQKWEEVNRVVAGGNYGWNVREGAHCFQADTCPTQTPDGDPLRDPVLEYPHGDAPVSGLAVVGGYVARDGRLPGFDGHYVFADWHANGRLFAADTTQDAPWEAWPVRAEGSLGAFVLGFGRDTTGTLYACTSQLPGIAGSTGAVSRLTGT